MTASGRTQRRYCRMLRTWAMVLAASSLRAEAALESGLLCPDYNAPPEKTLTMQCSDACSSPLSPCIYYQNASDCHSDEDQTSSECVRAPHGPAIAGECAFECFWPFNGADNSSWDLLVANQYEYKQDVIDLEARDPEFHLAKKNVSDLAAISDLVFPSSATTISLSGNAIPIDDKAWNFIVLEAGQGVNVSLSYELFENASECRELRVENLNLTGLDSFPALPNLETLILSDVLLRKVPDGISDLTTLSKLDLSMNSFISIPSNSIPPNIVELCLLECALESIPADIMHLPNLTHLDLSSNKFAVSTTGSLPLQLEQLIYYEMSQTTIPPDIQHMTSLKKLELGWNGYREPSAVANLPPSLFHLGLSTNYLVDLPPSFKDLINLEELDISYNAFRDNVPSVLPPNLKYLNASTNYIVKLPDNVLPASLTFLNLSYNSIKEPMPQGFTDLQALTNLYLDGNDLSRIPPEIFQLSSLQTLSIAKNDNMTGQMTLTSDQVDFLNGLSTFIIDQSVLSTSCSSPVTVGNYSVCVGSPHSTSTRSQHLWVYITVPLVVILLLLIGFGYYRWRQSGRFLCFVRQSTSGGKSRVLFSVDDHFGRSETVIDSNPTSAFLSIRKTSEHLSTPGSVLSNSYVGSSTRTAGSIWDDEELLKARIDFQQVQEMQVLSQGYFGEVWLATYMEQLVAVKHLKSQHTERSEIMRFIAEIKVHSRLDHPKIVRFIGVAWTMESNIKAVIEYMEWGDLRSYLDANVPTTRDSTDVILECSTSYWDDQALTISIDTIEGLVYLHSLDPRVLHRDLKSRNVLLNAAMQAKITDFGVSTWHDDTRTTLTTGVGTARWAAPEVLAGNDKYTEAVDMYSFGVILSELDTHRVPFSEHDAMPESYLLSRVAGGELRPAFSIDVPDAIAALALQCLSFDPTARPSALQVAYVLRKLRDSLESTSESTEEYEAMPRRAGMEVDLADGRAS